MSVQAPCCFGSCPPICCRGSCLFLFLFFKLSSNPCCSVNHRPPYVLSGNCLLPSPRLMLKSPFPVVLNAIPVSPNIILKAIPYSGNLEAVHPPMFVVLESIAPPPAVLEAIICSPPMLPLPTVALDAIPQPCCSGCPTHVVLNAIPSSLLFWMLHTFQCCCSGFDPFLLFSMLSQNLFVTDAIPSPLLLWMVYKYFPTLIFRVQSHSNCSGCYPQPL